MTAVTKRKMSLPIAILFYGMLGLVVAAFLIVSGIANVVVWWDSAQGWNRYVFSVIGIGSEAWGAFGLLLMTRRFSERDIARGLCALLLWLPAVGFNGYSTYRYFTIEGSDKAAIVEIDRTRNSQADDRIVEITTELEAIGVTRTPTAIRQERDNLPNNYRTRRAELSAELSTAERRATLENELATVRETVVDTAGVATATGANALTDWRVLTALVIWMEAIKALALWVIAGKTERKERQDRQVKPTVANENLEQSSVVETATSTGKVVKLL